MTDILLLLVGVFLFMIDFICDVLRRVSEEFGISLDVVVERFRRIARREGLDYFLVSDDGFVVDARRVSDDFCSLLSNERIEVDVFASRYGLDASLMVDLIKFLVDSGRVEGFFAGPNIFVGKGFVEKFLSRIIGEVVDYRIIDLNSVSSEIGLDPCLLKNIFENIVRDRIYISKRHLYLILAEDFIYKLDSSLNNTMIGFNDFNKRFFASRLINPRYFLEKMVEKKFLSGYVSDKGFIGKGFLEKDLLKYFENNSIIFLDKLVSRYGLNKDVLLNTVSHIVESRNLIYFSLSENIYIVLDGKRIDEARKIILDEGRVRVEKILDYLHIYGLDKRFLPNIRSLFFKDIFLTDDCRFFLSINYAMERVREIILRRGFTTIDDIAGEILLDKDSVANILNSIEKIYISNGKVFSDKEFDRRFSTATRAYSRISIEKLAGLIGIDSRLLREIVESKIIAGEINGSIDDVHNDIILYKGEAGVRDKIIDDLRRIKALISRAKKLLEGF